MRSLPCSPLGRFGLVGLLGAGLQLLSLYLLTKGLHLRQVVAAPMAVEIAVLHNFLWHERFTWRERKVTGLASRAIRLWRFHAANGFVSLFGNTLLIYCFVERLKLPVLPSTIGAIGLCSLLNFLLADRWVFRFVPIQGSTVNE